MHAAQITLCDVVELLSAYLLGKARWVHSFLHAFCRWSPLKSSGVSVLDFLEFASSQLCHIGLLEFLKALAKRLIANMRHTYDLRGADFELQNARSNQDSAPTETVWSTSCGDPSAIHGLKEACCIVDYVVEIRSAEAKPVAESSNKEAGVYQRN